ncbi:MAG TPA: DUF2207 domain-containing protein [Acidimicrobiales bacterium]|nr:DUF2207 domain-containing protein [Acidimicrobiales bacterium]
MAVTSGSGRLRVVVAAVFVFGLVFVTQTQSAAAQTQGERIHSYDVQVVVLANGTIDVTETIDYDFGFFSRHGILREFVTSQGYEPADDPDPRATSVRRDLEWTRRYPLDVISVESDAPDKYAVESVKPSFNADLQTKRVRIGDKDVSVNGRHMYTIRYVQKGAVNALPGDDELYWNIVGTGWNVPIDQVRVDVASETGAITRVACFSGSAGSTTACPAQIVDGVAQYTEAGLGPFQGVTIVATIPDADGPAVEPVKNIREKWSLERAFDITPATVAGAAAVGLFGIGGVGLLLFRVGRDRRAIGTVTDIAFSEGAEDNSERVGLFENVPTPVEFVPPDGIRPAQLGVLIDESADNLDVSATIVDLAVRGYLRIEEVPNKRGKVKDHRLVRLAKNEGLLPYEQLLVHHLFETGPVVEMSQLKNKFASDMRDIKSALYDDAVEREFFFRRPDQVRQKWTAIGFFGLAIGAGLLIASILLTHNALVVAPLAVAGLALAIGARFMPRRTARGTGAYRRALGFEDFIENSEKHRAQFAERENLFTEYLPYAIVFGCTDKWARTFESLGYQPDTTSWYIGAYPFAFASFSNSIQSFSSSAGTLLSSTPASSGGSGGGGGGFSGGGGGGGGGGSW